MAENKKSFLIQAYWYDFIKTLSSRDTGLLFGNILNYVNGIECDKLPKHLQKFFDIMVADIEKGWSTYNPKTKRYHWNYKGGITPENKAIRNSDKMKWWRVNVFERDDYTCQECGQVGGELNAHHIKEFAKHPELRFDVNNGITICKNCHKKIHQK